MPSTVLRKSLLRKMCAWVETQQLFHEDSTYVAVSVRCALGKGLVRATLVNTYSNFVGSEDTGLRLVVQHELRHENVHLTIGLLNVSTALEPGGEKHPAYTYSQSRSSIKTDVPMPQVACTRDNLTFLLSVLMFPLRPEQNRKVRKARRRGERWMCVSPRGALQSRTKPYI